MIALQRFPDTAALDAALAAAIVQALCDGIRRRGAASLVLSGGRTPRGLFARLANTPLDWDRVWITLADDRWVPEDHADSNARTVREGLLQAHAAKARFVPLVRAEADPWSALAASAESLASLPRPFDAVVLGMGDDGHTASLFPAADTLPPPSPAATPELIGVRPARAPHARITLTPAALLDTRALALHITGAAKWSVLCEALKPGPVAAYPVRHVIHQNEVPCRVYWTA